MNIITWLLILFLMCDLIEENLIVFKQIDFPEKKLLSNLFLAWGSGTHLITFVNIQWTFETILSNFWDISAIFENISYSCKPRFMTFWLRDMRLIDESGDFPIWNYSFITPPKIIYNKQPAICKKKIKWFVKCMAQAVILQNCHVDD